MTRHLRLGCAAMLLATSAAAEDLIFTPGDDPRFSWDAYEAFAAAHDLSGQELSILAPWTGGDAELFERVIAYFKAATGAAVDYSGTSNFEDDVIISLNAGSPPNIAIFPQPGLVADLAGRGQLSALSAELDQAVRSTYAAGDSWSDLATFSGADGNESLFGVFYKVDLKSLVWYVPDAFDEAGYDVPETMEDLRELTETIAADGETPWCIGLGSGGATGWPATDWVEDLLLRTAPAETYDAWVAGDIPFDSDEIIAAVEEFGWFARSDSFTVGGARGAAGTDFRDSVLGLFKLPPQCYLHKQATFIPVFFPEDVELGQDVDFFYFPAYDAADLGRPVLGAGTLATIAEDSPAARAFMQFLLTPIAHELWMAQSGFLSPHLKARPEAYANDTLREQGRILAEATVFRFDGSDLMPGEIGTSAFWTAMVEYVTGAEAAEVLATVQERRDGLR
ncbi:MAG: ABC transporter substrate-binding protein [Pseudomonadota bacterium]